MTSQFPTRHLMVLLRTELQWRDSAQKIAQSAIVSHQASLKIPSQLPIKNLEMRNPEMSTSNPRVLLVEDSKFLRLTNERILTKAGYEVCIAADGEEALSVAQAKLPDVILLDMMLPKLSGPEVLRRLKANPATADIPVIVLTSLSQKNEEKLLQEGAAAYFEKSALELDKNSDGLAATVATVLSRLSRPVTTPAGLQASALE